MRSRKKTIIALLPAVLAFLVVAVFGKSIDPASSNPQLFLGAILGLLIVGGIISAWFVTSWMAMMRPDRGFFLLGIVFLVILVLYVVTFFFTGCLVAFNTGLLD